MKRKKIEPGNDDDLLPEYDLDALPIIARGPGYQRRARLVRVTRVTLDADVAAIFPDEKAVNEALRTLMRVTTAKRRKTG